jgi:hypothetical protein
MNLDKSKLIIAHMAFHNSEAVSNLLASMPIQAVVIKKADRQKNTEKTMVGNYRESVNQLTWMMNRSVTL